MRKTGCQLLTFRGKVVLALLSAAILVYLIIAVECVRKAYAEDAKTDDTVTMSQAIDLHIQTLQEHLKGLEIYLPVAEYKNTQMQIEQLQKQKQALEMKKAPAGKEIKK